MHTSGSAFRISQAKIRTEHEGPEHVFLTCTGHSDSSQFMIPNASQEETAVISHSNRGGVIFFPLPCFSNAHDPYDSCSAQLLRHTKLKMGNHYHNFVDACIPLREIHAQVVVKSCSEGETCVLAINVGETYAKNE